MNCFELPCSSMFKFGLTILIHIFVEQISGIACHCHRSHFSNSAHHVICCICCCCICCCCICCCCICCCCICCCCICCCCICCCCICCCCCTCGCCGIWCPCGLGKRARYGCDPHHKNECQVMQTTLYLYLHAWNFGNKSSEKVWPDAAQLHTG